MIRALPRPPHLCDRVFSARGRPGSVDGVGDGILFGLCAFAALLAGVAIVSIAYQVVHGARPAISKFGLGFLASRPGSPTSAGSGPAR